MSENKSNISKKRSIKSFFVVLFIITIQLCLNACEGCAFNADDADGPKVKIESSENEYRGGLFKAWVNVPSVVTDLDDIRGKSKIFSDALYKYYIKNYNPQ